MYIHFNEKQDPNMIGLSDKLMSMLDSARTLANIPFIITSGVRTPEHNKEVGGVANSSHLKGLAADLQCSNSETRFNIVKNLLCVGFNRIEIKKGHIHIDIDETKDQNVIFLG